MCTVNGSRAQCHVHHAMQPCNACPLAQPIPLHADGRPGQALEPCALPAAPTQPWTLPASCSCALRLGSGVGSTEEEQRIRATDTESGSSGASGKHESKRQSMQHRLTALSPSPRRSHSRS